MTMRRSFSFAIVLGVILSLFISTTAFAADFDSSSHPPKVKPGEPVTFKFLPDPGVTYTLRWDTDYKGENIYNDPIVERHRSECTGTGDPQQDAEQPGCQVTVSYTEPGSHVVAARWGDGQLDITSDWVTVEAPPAPLLISDKRTIVSGRDALTVKTPRKVLDGDCSAKYECTVDVKRIGREGDLNVYRVHVYAAKGTATATFEAYDELGGRKEESDPVKLKVTAYRGPSWKVFRNELMKVEINKNGLHTGAEMSIMAVTPVRWELAFTVTNAKKKAVWRGSRSGSSVRTKQKYGRYPYAWQTRTPLAKLTGARCKSEDLRLKAVWTVYSSRGKVLWRRSRNAPVPNGSC